VKRIFKRVSLGILILLGLILLFLAALQILGPRIVNQEAVKNRIETAVSTELGGHLQYEKLGFRILPRPSIVIRRPVFEIPGSVAGSIQTLYIDFEFLSLLTGRPRIADADLDRPEFTIALGLPGPASGPPATTLSEPPVAPVLGWLAIRMPNLAIAVEKGRWIFVRDGKTLFSLDSVEGRIAFSPRKGSSPDPGTAETADPFRMNGRLEVTVIDHVARTGPVRIEVGAFEAGSRAVVISEGRLATLDTAARFSGRAEDYLSGTLFAEVTAEGTVGPETLQKARTVFHLETLPPGPVEFRIAKFKIRPGLIELTDGRIKLQDSALRVSARIENYGSETASAEFAADGAVGPDSVAWIRTTADLPAEWTPRAPVTFSKGHVAWKTDGAIRAEGSASLPDHVSISFDVEQSPQFLGVHALRVRDPDSQASLAFNLNKKVLTVSFSGHLTESTMNRIFEEQRFKFGYVKGDFHSRAVLDRPRETTARGRLEAERVIPPIKTALPVFINHATVQASGNTVHVDPLDLTLGTERHTLHGRITARREDWLVDLQSDALKWEPLYQLFGSDDEAAGAASSDGPQDPIRATIRVAAPSFTMAGWTAAPARVEITVGPDPLHIAIQQALVCGIDLPGVITVTSNGLTLEFHPSAHAKSVQSTFSCLGAANERATGTFDLAGTLRASGSGSALLDSLDGNVSISAKDGVILEDSIAIRILTYLNVTDLLRGQFSNLGNEGIPYQSADLRATVEKGTVSLNETVLKSPVVNLVGKGTIRLKDRTLDLTVLAAPFTSVDKMISKIPVIRYIMAGTLVTIPIRVTGPIDRPDVKTMPPATVASELGDLMGRVLKSPYKIIEPILPGEKGGR
jgi:AsmA-like C-terminal region